MEVIIDQDATDVISQSRVRTYDFGISPQRTYVQLYDEPTAYPFQNAKSLQRRKPTSNRRLSCVGDVAPDDVPRASAIAIR